MRYKAVFAIPYKLYQRLLSLQGPSSTGCLHVFVIITVVNGLR